MLEAVGGGSVRFSATGVGACLSGYLHCSSVATSTAVQWLPPLLFRGYLHCCSVAFGQGQVGIVVMRKAQ